MAGRSKSGSGVRRSSRELRVFGETTLSEAHRERLAKPVVSRELRDKYEEATGEILEDGFSPTWAEFLSAMLAYRAATSPTGSRDAKELREATERASGDGGDEPAFLLSMDGLPRTNAVTGQAPAEMDGEEE